MHGCEHGYVEAVIRSFEHLNGREESGMQATPMQSARAEQQLRVIWLSNHAAAIANLTSGKYILVPFRPTEGAPSLLATL